MLTIIVTLQVFAGRVSCIVAGREFLVADGLGLKAIVSAVPGSVASAGALQRSARHEVMGLGKTASVARGMGCHDRKAS